MSRLSSNGIELEFEECGEAAAPLVILVAGLGEQMGGVEFPQEFCRALAERSFRVVRFDNRDVGLSTHLHDAEPGSYTVVDMADDVVGLVAGLGAAGAHLVGASMGGFIVRWAAIRYPALVRSVTVIMSGAGSRPDNPATKRLSKMDRATVEKMLAKTRPAESAEAAIESYVEAWRSYNGSGFAFDADWVRDCGRLCHARCYDPQGVGRQSAAVFNAPDLLEAQEVIACNTAVIHGDEDPIFGEDHAREIADRIRGAKLEVIRGMGHEMPREAWPQIIRAIELASSV